MNLKALAEELELEADEYLELISLFVESSINDMETIENALANGESEKAANSAHSIKGAAGNLGFPQLYETAKNIEMAARDGRLEDISEDLVILKEELTSIETLIEEWS